MKIHVTIPTSTYDVLCRFGNINEVVNKICDLVVNDQIPYTDLPGLQSRKGHKQFDVFIENELFISLYTTMKEAGKPIRLRRVLQYFVDMEMYVDLEWPIVTEAKVVNDKEVRNISKLCNVIQSVCELRQEWLSYSAKFDDALNVLQEVLNERRQRFNERKGNNQL